VQLGKILQGIVHFPFSSFYPLLAYSNLWAFICVGPVLMKRWLHSAHQIVVYFWLRCFAMIAQVANTDELEG
jgi:hypothetical protein